MTQISLMHLQSLGNREQKLFPCIAPYALSSRGIRRCCVAATFAQWIKVDNWLVHLVFRSIIVSSASRLLSTNRSNSSISATTTISSLPVQKSDAAWPHRRGHTNQPNDRTLCDENRSREIKVPHEHLYTHNNVCGYTHFIFLHFVNNADVVLHLLCVRYGPYSSCGNSDWWGNLRCVFCDQ